MERTLGGIFLHGERMASITATKLLPYPSHPYRDSADLAQLLLDNGLTGISVRDLADRMGVVGYYPSRVIGMPFLLLWQVAVERKLPFLLNTA